MDEITKSIQSDIEDARLVTGKQVGMGNGGGRTIRISAQIDELIAALQNRIDALKRVKESL